MTGALYWTEAELDGSFAAQVSPDAERLLSCLQCGSCTASCPTADAMASDTSTPRYEPTPTGS